MHVNPCMIIIYWQCHDTQESQLLPVSMTLYLIKTVAWIVSDKNNEWLKCQLTYILYCQSLFMNSWCYHDIACTCVYVFVCVYVITWSSTLLAPNIFPHALQVLNVLLPCLPEWCRTVVLDPKLPASLFEQRGDPEVVTLGHVREEVVCCLVVKPSRHDVPEPTVGAVVACG